MCNQSSNHSQVSFLNLPYWTRHSRDAREDTCLYWSASDTKSLRTQTLRGICQWLGFEVRKSLLLAQLANCPGQARSAAASAPSWESPQLLRVNLIFFSSTTGSVSHSRRRLRQDASLWKYCWFPIPWNHQQEHTAYSVDCFQSLFTLWVIGLRGEILNTNWLLKSIKLSAYLSLNYIPCLCNLLFWNFSNT